MSATMIQRQMSEGGTSERNLSIGKKWRTNFIGTLRKRPSMLIKEEKHARLGSTADSDSHDSLGLRNSEVNGSSSVMHDSQESNARQLREVLHRMRTAPSGPKDVDAAYDVFSKHKERARVLCMSVLQDEFKPARSHLHAPDAMPRRDSSIESPNALYDHRSSFSGRSLSEVITGSIVTGSGGAGRNPVPNEGRLSAIREWKLYLDALSEWFKTSLADTYRKFEPEATPDMLEALFTSKKFRREAVHRMRNASVTRVRSADPQFFPRYEIRFRNYEKVKLELSEIRSLLQAGESGINPDRVIEEHAIDPRGDAILEFANLHPEAQGNEPVLRFRVSSARLADTSPIFARMFDGNANSMYLHDDEDISSQLPASPTKYICRDGAEAKLYRMPQIEVNKLNSMSILLHAAHMHNEHVPREVSFDLFVAIADVSIRYKSTSPLELCVEHRWLPQWMHKGADEMPDGILAISYAFGSRELFTRMSKSAVLNLVDEKDLQSKPWSPRLKDKIWAVRSAKLAQVYACCTSTMQEYLREPTHNPVREIDPISQAEIRNYQHSTVAPSKPAVSLSSTPRCPKGSHWCDAMNLGWMTLVFNEMNILSHMMRPNVLTHLPESQQQPSRSLAQLVEALRRVPSPVSPIHHGGVCDPIGQFRIAINDIFNSITGLTLYDVSGKSHGWGLSKHRESEPQSLVTWGLKRMAAPDLNHSVATEFPESVRLKILAEIDDIDELHAMAMVNRVYYSTYKTHELYLMRNILRAGRVRNSSILGQVLVPKSISNAEEKVPKEISDSIQQTGPIEQVDALTLRSEDDDDYDFDDGESLDGTPAPSITMSLHREMRTRIAATRSTQFTGVGFREPNYVRPPSHPPPADYDPFHSVVSSEPSTPRAATPRPESPPDDETYEPPLTDEEARRILWPDAVNAEEEERERRRKAASGTPPPDAVREKFRFEDRSLMEGLEDKSLKRPEEKQLRSEAEKTVGLHKGRPPENAEAGSGSAGGCS